MAKKNADHKAEKPAEAGAHKQLSPEDMMKEMESRLPPEVAEKLKVIKEKLDKYKGKILEKFDKYIMGIALLPPPQARPPELKEEQGPGAQHEKPNPDEIGVLVLVDDSDVQKMTKDELVSKLDAVLKSTAEEIDKNIAPQSVLLSELWQNCYDGKYEVLQLIAMSAPIYDKGMLSAVKISEVHKQMVLKKFEKYIVAYVLAGSLVQGKATPESDIDVFIVIDDTDVKKMTRAELKDKLRAIIIGMGIEAGEITGIRNKINIQVYIMTDFWENIKDANPIIFTFLRDGVPFFDRGIFMPWKQLLKMGRVKPSGEAIELYMSTGEQVLKRIQFRLNEIGMEDLFYAILNPSQAAIMMYGVPPTTPKETPHLMREIFVQKEKIFKEEDIKTLDRIIQLRKELEHGTKKDVSGKEIDELLKACDKYLHAIKDLFKAIEEKRDKESVVQIYDTVMAVTRDALKGEGVEKAKDDELAGHFEDKLVHTGKLPDKFLRILKSVMKGKKDHDSGKLTKSEVEKIRKESNEFVRNVVEYSQRKRVREFERAKIRVKYGEKVGEVVMFEKEVFVIKDVEQPDKDILRARLNDDGSLGMADKSSLEELDKTTGRPKLAVLKDTTMESLKKIFGKDMHVLLSY